jgi:hypothetical protein
MQLTGKDIENIVNCQPMCIENLLKKVYDKVTNSFKK